MTYDGKWLLDVCEALDLKKQQLAKLIGCSDETVYRWANDTARIPHATILLLRLMIDDPRVMPKVMAYNAEAAVSV